MAGKKRLKWEPVAAMIALIFLGVWLVTAPRSGVGQIETREDARLVEHRIGNTRGAVEIVDNEDGATFRLIYRDGTATDVMDADIFKQYFGQAAFDDVTSQDRNLSFRVLNITSWSGLVWVAIGFGGQIAFFGRMFIQWVISEKKRQSTIPDIFWWLSLIGGISLFTYFVWRQDIVGVLGQSSGVVIYARNLRLIHKEKKREARKAAQAEPIGPNPGDALAGEASRGDDGA